MVNLAATRKWVRLTGEILYSHRIQARSNSLFLYFVHEWEFRWSIPPYIALQIHPSTGLSLLYQSIPSSIIHPIPTQEADNALVTSPESRMSLDSVNHQY
ncbi:hypothetical protein EVAR_37235_1 [Eumeta japonica]|uniref:Uncharacterized protein n=1 Tax=Eumeta variegata TaxID=151549 RepID=A0A4C1Y6L1_EUMVA|nr:hypothetical protein EVAR_37235_1 [Eumeta japonica]